MSHRRTTQYLDSGCKMQWNYNLLSEVTFKLINNHKIVCVFVQHDGAYRSNGRTKPTITGMSAAEEIALRTGLPATQLRLRIIAKIPKMIGRDQTIDFLTVDHGRIVAGRRTKLVALVVVSGIDICAAIGNQVDSIQYCLK